jgi:hypothetical protein
VHDVDFLFSAEPRDSRQRPQVILAEVQVRDLAVRRLEDLWTSTGAQEIRMDAYTRQIELHTGS